MTAVFKPIASADRLSVQVAERLAAAIQQGHLKPGDKLPTEAKLVEQFQVSRTVVREALQHLQAEGLITIIPYKGPVVATLTLQDANELYEVRGSLESLACAGFANNASDAQVAQLRAAFEFLRTPQASATPKDLLDAKNAFYATLLEGCGNRVIGTILTQLNNRVSVLRRVSLGSPGRLAQTLLELEEVVQAVERRDASTAARLAAAHVAKAADIVRESFTTTTATTTSTTA